MRTLTIHTADELVERWKRWACDLEKDVGLEYMAAAQAYRVCAAELAAIVAASMELEAAHHGDPEDVRSRNEMDDVTSGNVWPEEVSPAGRQMLDALLEDDERIARSFLPVERHG